jgi:pimeloyl-ACP methyl ester carboxylesterase
MESVFKSEQAKAAALASYDEILKHWPVPYEALDVPTSFGQTHIIASGSPTSPPLILLHGAGGNAMMWIFNIEELSKHFRVYAIDVIGEANKSAATRPAYNSNQYADWLREIADHFNMKKIVVCGASLGGLFAQQFALKYPQYISALVMLAPPSLLKIRTGYIYRAMLAGMFPDYLGKLFFKYMSARKDYPAYITDSFIKQMKAYKPGLDSIPVMSDEDLKSLPRKTIVVLGAKEVLYDPVAAAERIRDIAPFIRVDVIPAAKHVSSMDRPELINKILIELAITH